MWIQQTMDDSQSETKEGLANNAYAESVLILTNMETHGHFWVTCLGTRRCDTLTPSQLILVCEWQGANR